jgi:hypothetical protein
MLDSMLNSLVRAWELGIGNWEDSYALVTQSPIELVRNFRREGLAETILTIVPGNLKGLTFPEG